MKDLRKFAGVAALFEALIYLTAFVIYGAVLDAPVNADSTQRLLFLSENQLILSAVNLMMYVLFGLLLAVLVLALHDSLKNKMPTFSQVAAVFGVIWVGLVIASGMIANIGLDAVITLSTKEPEQAMTVWLAVNSVVEGLGGGNELVGGIWVLLLSIAALKADVFSKKLNYLGTGVGLAGILSVIPTEIFTLVFGLGQIVWFIWLGGHLLTQKEYDKERVDSRKKSASNHTS